MLVGIKISKGVLLFDEETPYGGETIAFSLNAEGEVKIHAMNNHNENIIVCVPKARFVTWMKKFMEKL